MTQSPLTRSLKRTQWFGSVVFLAVVFLAVVFIASSAQADGGGAGLRIQLPPVTYTDDPEDSDEPEFNSYVPLGDRFDVVPAPRLSDYKDEFYLSVPFRLSVTDDVRIQAFIKDHLSATYDNAPTVSTPLHVELFDPRVVERSFLYSFSPTDFVVSYFTARDRLPEPRFSTALRYSHWGMRVGYDVETESSGFGSLFSADKDDEPKRYVTPNFGGFTAAYRYVAEKNEPPSESEAPTITEVEPDFSIGIRYQFRDGSDTLDSVYGRLRLEYGAFDGKGNPTADQSEAQSVPPITNANLKNILWAIPDHLRNSKYRFGDITGNPFLHDFSSESEAAPPPTPPASEFVEPRQYRFSVGFRF